MQAGKQVITKKPRGALTQGQVRDGEKEQMLSAILRAFMAKNGELDKSKADFAALIGVSHNTWANWKKSGLKSAKLWSVLDAAQRVGLKITITIE